MTTRGSYKEIPGFGSDVLEEEGFQRSGSFKSQSESKIDYEQGEVVATGDIRDGESEYKLHKLLEGPCNNRKAGYAEEFSIHTLQIALDEDPTAACKLFKTGDTELFLLHLALQNFDSLLKRGLLEEELLMFCLQLFRINPSALLLKDQNYDSKTTYVIPFAILRSIYSWIVESYPDEALPNSKKSRHRKLKRYMKESSSSIEEKSERLDKLFESTAHGNHSHRLIDECFPRAFLPLSREVEYMVKFLSIVIDTVFSEDQQQEYQASDISVDDVLDIVIVGLVSIPCFLKTLLFCKDCEEIFALSLVKHLILESHGPWLQPLIRCHPEKALIYFQILSKFLGDDVGGLIDRKYLKPENGEGQIADRVSLLQAKRDNLVESLWSQNKIFAVLAEVIDPLLIQLAQTRCAECLVDSDAKKYFSVCLLFFDMIYHAIFPISFHFAAILLLAYHDVRMYILFSRFNLVCLIYFIARKILHLVSTFGSKKHFLSTVLSLWNWIDWLAILTTGLANREMTNGFLSEGTESFVVSRSLVDLLVFATIFLTLHLLGYIRMLNEELAVFVYSLIQTVKDMKWFLLVLAIVLASFAQMLAFLNIEADNCSANEGTCEFKSSIQLKNVYQMMLGDWDEEKFSTSRGYFIFVMFTFFVSLIMLNILIAIASSSYETAKSVGPGIFRMERIKFCAEITSIERLLLQRTDRRWLIAVALALPVTSSIIYYDVYKLYKHLPDDGNEDNHHLEYIISTGAMVFFIVLTFGTLAYVSMQERQLVTKYELRLNGGWFFKTSTFLFYITALYGGRLARWVTGTVEKVGVEDIGDDASFGSDKSTREQILEIKSQYDLLLHALKSIDEKISDKR